MSDVRPSGKEIALWLVFSTAIVIIDRATKLWIESLFYRGERMPVTDFFNLVLVYNRGAAFSFLSDAGGWQRYLLIAVSLAAVALILWLLARQAGGTNFRLSLAMILGGAVGNLWDRFATGEVVDFLDFHLAGYHWPAFNVADSAISVGAVLLIVDSFRGARDIK